MFCIFLCLPFPQLHSSLTFYFGFQQFGCVLICELVAFYIFSIWVFLTFLDLCFVVFHLFWKILGHFFLKYFSCLIFLLFFSLEIKFHICTDSYCYTALRILLCSLQIHTFFSSLYFSLFSFTSFNFTDFFLCLYPNC